MSEEPETDATEAARKHADKLDVDIDTVEGTGSGGQVTKADVQQGAEDIQAEDDALAAKQARADKKADKKVGKKIDKKVDKTVYKKIVKQKTTAADARIAKQANADKKLESDAKVAEKAMAEDQKTSDKVLAKLETEPYPGRRLGRVPTPPAMLKKNLMLASYLPEVLPKQPTLPIDVSDNVVSWPMYLNNQLGDCACAAPAHMEEIFSADTGKFRLLTDADVLALYELQGYVPGNPATDQGSSMGQVLQDWRKDWHGSVIWAYCQVDETNEDHIQLALWLFRGLYIGIALPLTAQGQTIWDVVPDMPGRNEPGSWGGHAVNVVAINADGSRDFISWGQRMRMTKAFWLEYVDEVYAVVTGDLMAGATLPTNGFSLEQLEADMAELGSQ